MTNDKAFQEVSKLAFDWLYEKLNIDETVTLNYNDDYRNPGYVCITARYKTADIYLNASKIEDLKHLYGVMLHEFCHVLMSDYEILTQSFIASSGDDKTDEAMKSEVCAFVDERVIVRLEKLFLKFLDNQEILKLLEEVINNGQKESKEDGEISGKEDEEGSKEGDDSSRKE